LIVAVFVEAVDLLADEINLNELLPDIREEVLAAEQEVTVAEQEPAADVVQAQEASHPGASDSGCN